MVNIRTNAYELAVENAKIGVILDGTMIARLDVRSAVHQTNDANETVKDVEKDIPTLLSCEKNGAVTTFVWKNRSSLWDEKTYTLTCDPLRFTYKVTVKGHGRVDGVEYFTGDVTEHGHGSDYEFSHGFTPCISWYNKEDYYFKASEPCHRWSVLMVPPMFCYSFRCERMTRQLMLGLVAQRGEHNFHSFDYTPTSSLWKYGFYLSTDQHGHTVVDGQWEAPAIIGTGAEDEFEAMKKYSAYYFSSGIAKTKKAAVPPKFWHGPIACGWIEQMAHPEIPISMVDLARESLYEMYLDKLHEAGLYPRCLIIDDKWQTEYCTDVANPEKWPDLRAFVDKRHAEGIHTMLWFKIFDPEGLRDEATVTSKQSGERVDVSHPEFLRVLDEALYRIFSSDEGCYDCDGIKIDYAFQIPIGREFRTYSGKYGVEWLYEFQLHIYETAKKIKPHAVINCSPCHPYFAHICDQGRLHDYDPRNRNCREDMEFRGKMFSIAMPNTLLDTDNAGFNTTRDTMRWMLHQDLTGIPDIYCVSPLPRFGMTEGDLAELAQMWKEYTDRIDAMYEE